MEASSKKPKILKFKHKTRIVSNIVLGNEVYNVWIKISYNISGKVLPMAFKVSSLILAISWYLWDINYVKGEFLHIYCLLNCAK